jgi:uncharacterized protein YndB with AHSA1/START domain
MDFVSEYSTDITIHAPADKIWEALTQSQHLKEVINATVDSSWQKGEAITYQHIYEGKPYEDKGKILDIVPGTYIRLAYLPAISDLADICENYQEVIAEITSLGPQLSTVRIEQKNIRDTFFGKRAPELWGDVLRNLKQLTEQD